MNLQAVARDAGSKRETQHPLFYNGESKSQQFRTSAKKMLTKR